MNSCNWEIIDGFQSYGEYEKFRNWIESQLTEGLIEEVPVIDYYISA